MKLPVYLFLITFFTYINAQKFYLFDRDKYCDNLYKNINQTIQQNQYNIFLNKNINISSGLYRNEDYDRKNLFRTQINDQFLYPWVWHNIHPRFLNIYKTRNILKLYPLGIYGSFEFMNNQTQTTILDKIFFDILKLLSKCVIVENKKVLTEDGLLNLIDLQIYIYRKLFNNYNGMTDNINVILFNRNSIKLSKTYNEFNYLEAFDDYQYNNSTRIYLNY